MTSQHGDDDDSGAAQRIHRKGSGDRDAALPYELIWQYKGRVQNDWSQDNIETHQMLRSTCNESEASEIELCSFLFGG